MRIALQRSTVGHGRQARTPGRGVLAAALSLALVALLHSAPAPAQEVWQLPDGPACIEQWIADAQRKLNAYNGDREFNSRKPWRMNQYGLFEAQGIRSVAAPDNWGQFGANKYQWMWGNYSTEAQFPNWNNANFNRSGLEGLRWFVRRCVAGGGSGTSGTGTQGGQTGAGTGAGPDGAAGGMALDTSATCPGNFSMHRGSTLILICYCAPNAIGGRGWGTGVYTHDSSLCAAARHAGAVGAGGGMIQVKGAPGRQAYQGTASNGITSANYGAYDWSFLFPGTASRAGGGTTSSQAKACPGTMTDLRGSGSARTCQCAPGSMRGGAWGTGVYTDDSILCAAALHAGAVSPAGGTVTAVAAPGRASYQGSTRNGITSKSYGRWDGSFYFR